MVVFSCYSCLPHFHPHGLQPSRLHSPWDFPTILELIAISFSKGSSLPRGQTESPVLAGGFFTAQPPGKRLQDIASYYSMKQGNCVSELHVLTTKDSLILQMRKMTAQLRDTPTVIKSGAKQTETRVFWFPVMSFPSEHLPNEVNHVRKLSGF